MRLGFEIASLCSRHRRGYRSLLYFCLLDKEHFLCLACYGLTKDYEAYKRVNILTRNKPSAIFTIANKELRPEGPTLNTSLHRGSLIKNHPRV